MSTEPSDKKMQTSPQKKHDIDTEHQPHYVVGIGASAGGLEALECLFANMPLNTGMAYVIVQHLSPDYKSMMDTLLARKTMIPIKVADNQMVIEADTIYLLPPKKEMIAANGRLYLTEREQTDAVNLPINTFFRSLAETYEEKGIGIVLSGTGSDGTKGIASIHDSGGFVIAQSPATCKFASMPENAIHTQKVDLVVDPQHIPATLVTFAKRTTKVEQQLNLSHYDDDMSEFSEILILINNRFDLDFSQYKPSTITRRLERRIAIQKTTSLKEYMNVLLSNQEELEALYYDLLIGVTQFFRDTTAFASLKTRISTLLDKFKHEPELRIWVSACATGQEAYSIAILLFEAMEHDPHGQKPFKIFATDIHTKSIQYAATGSYEKNELEGLTEQQINRFFTQLPSGKYQVVADIRKPIVFAQHNLLNDPPFTRTHLVSCRNLLIYFNSTAQQRVLSLLSFSLLNQGLLLLGSSEAIGTHSGDFEVVDPVYRLFRKTRTTERRLDIPLTVKTRVPSTRAELAPPEPSRLSAKSRKALETLLQRYVPASVLIDEQGHILHIFGDAGRFLSLTVGSASLNIRSLVNDQAKAVLTQMLQHIGKTHKPVKTHAVTGFHHYEKVDIAMGVLSESPSDLEYIIVSFTETATAIVKPTTLDALPLRADTETIVLAEGEQPLSYEQRIKELEDDLTYAHESLQTTVEELETSNEELQASNEELMASNEELQSTNEELQSVNEELFTVNAEFQQKEVERAQLKSDEQRIIAESNLGILFLDEDLKIRKFTPLAAQLFHLLDNDYGRPFSAQSNQLIQSITHEVMTVFQGGELVERELISDDGSAYMMRINAYAPPHERSDNSDNSDNSDCRGVVMTFTNISKMKATQTALEKAQTRFHNTLNAISDGYFEWNIDNNEVFFSPAFYEKLGYADERPAAATLLGQLTTTFTNKIAHARHQGIPIEEVLPFINKAGKAQWMVCKGRVLTEQEDHQTKLAGIVIDFTQQKSIEDQLHQQALKLERSNDLLEKFAYIVSHDMKAPLRHIQNYLVFLQEAVANNNSEAVATEIQNLKESTQGLNALIDDVITYARVTSENKTLMDVDVNHIIDSVVKTLDPLIKEKNIHVSRSDMPLLKGDRSLLTHLFQNLISNACKYTDKTQPDVRITHALDQDNIVITVSDNGIGFDNNYANKIFDPFKRLVTKDQFEGSGIGLSICKTVVEQHEGAIRAESRVGEGASFIITLPI